MRWLLIRFLAWMPLLLLVVAVNWSGDPGHLFRHAAVNRRIAQLMLEGKNVEVPRNFDQGQVLAEYATAVPAPPEVIVLGSSHMHLVRGTLFPGMRFFNASLAGGDLETMIASYGLFYPPGAAPRIVILGLDPWMLSQTHFHSVFYSPLDGSLDQMASRLGLPELKPKQEGWPERINRYYQMVSPSYFQSSVRAIGEERSTTTMTTADENSAGWTKRADGSFMSYDQSARAEPAETITMAVRKQYAEGSGIDPGFDDVSPERVRILRAFLELLHDSGVRVIALLPPIHREHYQAAVRTGRSANIRAIQEAFGGETSRLGVELRGDYDPSRCGLGDGDFFDEGHMHEGAEMRLFQGVGATTEPTTAHAER